MGYFGALWRWLILPPIQGATLGHEGGGSFLFFLFCIFLVLGLQEGSKQGRKQQPGRIGRKEGRKPGGREGRKEGGRAGRKEGRKGSHFFCSHLRWKHWQQRYFLLNPEPKPYGPRALRTVRP